MRKLRIYLDTSVISHLFHEDVPARQDATIRFFETAVRRRTHEYFVSYVNFDEIEQTKDPHLRESLLTALAEAATHIYLRQDRADEVARLAEHYHAKGILPRREFRDALHVAIATVHGMDALMSWNYRHLVNVNKEVLFHAASTELGYYRLLRFITPEEAIDED